MNFPNTVVGTDFNGVLKKIDDLNTIGRSRRSSSNKMKDQRSASLDEYIKGPSNVSKSQRWLEIWEQLTE